MPDFDPFDVDPTLSDDKKLIIADVVLAWARFDALMSQLLSVVFGLDLDTGAILFGSMGTPAKFTKIIKIYKHHGLSGAAKMKELQTLYLEHVDLRNSICHAACAGTLRSDPEKIVFAPVRAVHGTPGNMTIEVHHVDSIRAAAQFADRNGDEINVLIQHFLEVRGNAN